jgi:cellulose synthase/poly-beta-1,6-N-acetylglucosamine synthase-like glycosyltransferase
VIFLQILLLLLSLILGVSFFVYGINHYYLLSKSRHYISPFIKENGDTRPPVAIHLPVYNERYVVDRLLTAIAEMVKVYGIDKVSIFVLDDSDDGTSEEIDGIVKSYLLKDYKIEVLRRDNREGFKAGALQEALNRTKEEYIAIFDADFVPPVDFLLKTIPFFQQDDQIAIIQSRWTHLNRNYNLLTKAIAIGLDMHFFVEQAGRYAAGCFLTFNGSGGVIRKKAIIEAGGWQSDTLAEDLDLSYRIQSKGYRIIYLKDLGCPSEVPLTVPSFKNQQKRWACGTLRTARKILPTLLPNHEFSFKQRFQGFIHLTAYFIHPLLLISFLLTCATTFIKLDSYAISQINFLFPSGDFNKLVSIAKNLHMFTWGLQVTIMSICAIAPWISSLMTLKNQNLSIPRNIINLVVLFLLGWGISIDNTIEAGKALFTDKDWEFVRTPKYANLTKDNEWQTKKYQIPLDISWFLELVMICLGVVTILYAIWYKNYAVLPVILQYTIAYAFVLILTILQSKRKKIQPIG